MCVLSVWFAVSQIGGEKWGLIPLIICRAESAVLASNAACECTAKINQCERIPQQIAVTNRSFRISLALALLLQGRGGTKRISIIFLQERVLKKLSSSGSLGKINSEALANKVNKVEVIRESHLGQGVWNREMVQQVIRRRPLVKHALGRDESARVAALVQHSSRKRATHCSNASQHPRHTVIVEKHLAGDQLGENGTQRPHINPTVIVASEDYLRGAVATGLNVRAKVVCFEARRAKVNNFDLATRVRLDQNILRLEVTVKELLRMDVRQSLKNLESDLLDAG